MEGKLLGHYLVLTGAISNAGDFLIGHRLQALLEHLRPDRQVLMFDRRQPLDPDSKDVRQASAIIFGGGPAWQPNVYPAIYPLTQDLETIGSPLIPIGLGWKGRFTDPGSIRRYRFMPNARPLLERIERDGFAGTCRDFPTLEVLQHAGLTRQEMGGCPAWYALDSLGTSPAVPHEISSIAISPGALHMRHPSFADQARALLQWGADRFADATRIAVFHHPLDGAPNLSHNAVAAQQALAHAATSFGYEVRDVSGTADDMMSLYTQVDLHIGYRVHAHILRCSLRRPSILLAEDARGVGAAEALGGQAIMAIATPPKLVRPWMPIRPSKSMLEELSRLLETEVDRGWPQVHNSGVTIDRTFAVTKRVIEALP